MEAIKIIKTSNKLSAQELLLFIDNFEPCYLEKQRFFKEREQKTLKNISKENLNQFSAIAINIDFSNFLLYCDKEYSRNVLNKQPVKNNPVFTNNMREAAKIELLKEYNNFLNERTTK